MKESILADKSFAFALRVVKVCQELNSNDEFVHSKQLLKSGTSIGASVREAQYGQSTADFISKLTIALKESNETEYWLLLLKGSSLLSIEIAQEMILLNKELLRMIISTINTSNKNHPPKNPKS
jgi:four helix bundle protein